MAWSWPRLDSFPWFRRGSSGRVFATEPNTAMSTAWVFRLPPLAICLVAGWSLACTGLAGEPGPSGSAGGVGPAGASCWDLNENGSCDPDEDIDGDGLCNVDDCRVAPDGGGGAGGGAGQGGAEERGYVGTAVCVECHDTLAEQSALSAHANALKVVTSDEGPSWPYDDLTGGVPSPPGGRSWSDMAYVLGGFAWKAIYVQDDGYLLTGSADEQTQWTFANAWIGSDAGWQDFHPGQQRPFECGGCHTTGWIPCEAGDPSCPHQGELAGMAGSFAEPGVQCEACHGPGRAHASLPYANLPIVDRSAEACASCHRRGLPDKIEAPDGFIADGEQADELFSGKKRVMRCVDCHQPHRSAHYIDAELNPDRGIRISCESCHVGYDQNQASPSMQGMLPCVDCHMPPMARVASGDVGQFRGDTRTHLFAINTDQDAAQFYLDAPGATEYSHPYITLDYACNYCHGVTASPQSLDALEAMAIDYHL